MVVVLDGAVLHPSPLGMVVVERVVRTVLPIRGHRRLGRGEGEAFREHLLILVVGGGKLFFTTYFGDEPERA